METKKPMPLWQKFVGLVAIIGIVALIWDVIVWIFYDYDNQVNWISGIFWALVAFLVFKNRFEFKKSS